MPPGLNWAATVYHGMPANLFSFNPKGGDYLAFLGRISPEKRPDRAIEVAKRAGVRLKIAAKVDQADRVYFEQAIEPLLDDPLIEFIGEIGDDRKADFLGNALALLFPIDWPEPFGIVMIEAMAVGTPVIATRAGSVSEVIDDGVSGIVVDSVDEMVSAVEKVRGLSREGVRERFEARFTATRMANAYLRTYQRCLAQRRTIVSARPAGFTQRPIVVDSPSPLAAELPQSAANG
jgi:glycosyltransferase involved in cell wall biosynthesis